MWSCSVLLYRYIIKIHYHRQACVGPEHLVHQPHEGARGIGQPKWHNKPFIQPLLCFESSLLLISLAFSDLMIATFQINLGENFGTMKLIQHVIKPRNRVPILDCDIFDSLLSKHIL